MPASPEAALAHWPTLAGGSVAPLGAGLVNQTFLVTGAAGRHVLQRVSPVFSPAIHDNILAVTERLAQAGMITPRLVPAGDGRPCADLGEGGVWRVMTFVDGVSFDVVGGAAQARAGGELVARFHRAVDGLAHTFVGMRVGAHDIPRHLRRLGDAVEARRGHRLHGTVSALAAEIAAGAATVPALPALPDRVCHGDLKFNNLMFAGPGPAERERALCLIDLDTVGPMALAYELGHAWRSWCNRAGEDAAEARLDLEVFRASLDGYRDGLGRPLGDDEARALLLGVEWMSLELAARFATDALEEAYFGWDSARFPGRGEHNLVRAQGQWSLHRAFVASRTVRAALLGSS